jgi:hypothetical protein
VGKRFMLNSVRLWRYRVLSMRGDLNALRARLPPVLREAEERSDLYSLVNYRATALLQIALGDDAPERAEEELNGALVHLPANAFHVQHYFCLLSQVTIPLYRGDGARALTILTETWPRLKKSLLLRVPVIRAVVYDLLGRSALSATCHDRGRLPELRSVIRRASSTLRKEVDPWSNGLADALDAGCASLEGDHVRAREHLELAAQAQTTHGMDLYAAAARMALARLEGAERTGEPSDEGRSAMLAAGVQNPERMARLLVPVAI